MRWILLLFFLRYFCDARDIDPGFDGTRYERFLNEIIAKGVTDLGINVHKSTKKLNTNNHNYLVYSPVSIAAALYLLMLGAHGNTFTELSKILGFLPGPPGLNIEYDSIQIHEPFGALLRSLKGSGSNGSFVQFANGLFVQKDFPLRQLYKDVSSKIYQSQVVNLDFKSNPDHAKNYINKWTSKKTFGKIDQILEESPTSDTKVVLVNSLYFKAEWEWPFDSRLTKLQTFYPNGKSQRSRLQFPMMTRETYYSYHNDSTLSCEIVGLPYKGHEYTMYFIIPHDSNKKNLEHLESRLTYSKIKRLTSSTTEKKIMLTIPKMKLTSSLQLNNILKDNGLRTLFSPGANLGLLLSSNNDKANPNRRRDRQNVNPNYRTENSLDTIRHNINNGQNSASGELYVSKVLHKVEVDVNEKGTEAAAVTEVEATDLSESDVHAEVVVNVPFLFFIQHAASNLILFWGSVVTPSPTT